MSGLVVRTHVVFRYPAEVVLTLKEDGVLAVEGAQWFVTLLRRVPGLDIDEDLFQEDWGVVLFAQRNGKRFWIGLSALDPNAWIAHFHHAAVLRMQRFTASGTSEMKRLLVDVQEVMARAAEISDIAWHTEKSMNEQQVGSSTPIGD